MFLIVSNCCTMLRFNVEDVVFNFSFIAQSVIIFTVQHKATGTVYFKAHSHKKLDKNFEDALIL